jgi:hypothetical protein
MKTENCLIKEMPKGSPSIDKGAIIIIYPMK